MSTVLDVFVERFSDVFFPALGIRHVETGVPIMFSGPCDLLNQLVMEHVVKHFKGFVARRRDYDDFARLMSDVARASIDGTKRMVVVPDIHETPISEVKRLCSVPSAWVVATGRPTQTVSGLLYVQRIVPDTAILHRLIIGEAERNGIALHSYPPEGSFDTIAEFIAACDGCAPPDIQLADPADTAHRMVASGAAPSYMCKLLLRHAMKGCDTDDKRRAVAETCAACDAAMARCRRPLILSKILEYHIAQIARYSSSE